MIIKMMALRYDPTDTVAFFSIQMCNILHIILKLLYLLTKATFSSIQKTAIEKNASSKTPCN
jgi:hypothetical protein